MQQLAIAWKTGSTDLLDGWERVKACLIEAGIAEEKYQTHKGLIAFDRITNFVKGLPQPHFGIDASLMDIDLSVGPGQPEDLLRLTSSADINWDDWVDHLGKAGELTQAFLVDSEYDRWQNAQDPIIYEALERPY